MKNLKQGELCIAAQDKSALLGYSALFASYAPKLVHLEREDVFASLDAKYQKIIIIDLSYKISLEALQTIQNLSLEPFFVLITPYQPSLLSTNTSLLEKINLVLTKPLKIDLLKKYVDEKVSFIAHQKMLEEKNNALVSLVELSPFNIAIYTPDGYLFYANERYLEHNELAHDSIDKIHFDDLKRCDIGFEYLLHALEYEITFTNDREYKKRWFSSTFYKSKNNLIIHVCEDTTLQKQREIELEQSAIFFENSSEGIMLSNSKNIIISVNEAFCTITGYTKDEVIGKTPKILNSGIHDKAYYENMYNSLKYNKRFKGEIWNRRKNGEIYPEWLSISVVHNERYQEKFYIAIFTDITSLKESDKKIHFYANHDSLTALPNRFQFESQLKNALDSARSEKTKLAVMFIDVDKFKDINDTFGHKVGDDILINIAKKLKSVIRKQDLLARLGGDEFVIIAKNIKDENSIQVLLQKIMQEMKNPIIIEKKSFKLSLSIGIAMYPQSGLNADEIIKNADIAMYEVKNSGRNGFVIYDASMSSRVTNKVTLQRELQDAIKRDEFVMHYQPAIDIASNKIIGAEALVRWEHPTRGLLYPNNFLDFVSESEMEKEFGYLVFQKVFQEYHALASHIQNENFKIAINVSANHFFDLEFVIKLKELCDDFHIEPSSIELEILETQLILNPQEAQVKFNALKELGFMIALDDFGTGYSSLNYLKSFKVNKLKIDQSFIRDIMEDKEDDAIVQAIINLAKFFGMRVQAEGVETQEIFEKIKEYGCDYSQGYLHAKPLDLLTFISMASNE